MKRYINPPSEIWSEITARPGSDDYQLWEQVREIIRTVASQGDKALFAYAERFDRVRLASLDVVPEEIETAKGLVSPELKSAIDVAAENIIKFHTAQLVNDFELETTSGVMCGVRNVPIQRVGLYVPGGSAPLFSTVLMLGIPARLGGCREVVLCTPPDIDGRINPAILYSASVCGITKIIKVGGAQAIAAMAYGTESVPKVDKIFGPGNRFVTTAKQIVSLDRVAIDMPAGPSEVLIMADETSNPTFVAADLLSQAEHGADSQVILVTNYNDLIPRVESEVERLISDLGRESVARKALENSRLIFLDSFGQMVSFVNSYAPEHLIISMSDAEAVSRIIESAGSIFLGNYSPESVGDYASGTNHTLPTGGWATSCSGITIDSFKKKIMIQRLSPEGLLNLGHTVELLAEAEGLDAHKMAVTVRLNELEKKN